MTLVNVNINHWCIMADKLSPSQTNTLYRSWINLQTTWPLILSSCVWLQFFSTGVAQWREVDVFSGISVCQQDNFWTIKRRM